MENLSAEEKIDKLLKLDKFEIISGYYYVLYIDGTEFRYNVSTNTWLKLVEPHIYTHPVHYNFYRKIIKEGGINVAQESSSIEEVLETVSDDIRDTILFNINLFR